MDRHQVRGPIIRTKRPIYLTAGLAVGLLLGLSACQTNSRPITSYYAKPKITPAQYDADEADCAREASAVYLASRRDTDAKVNVAHQPSLVGAAVMGMSDGLQRGQAHVQASKTGHKAAEACILRKGYQHVQMTEEQKELVAKLSPEQKKRAGGLLAAGEDLRSLMAQ